MLDIDPECGVAYGLKDGVALCRLMSKLQPGTSMAGPSDSSLAYKQVRTLKSRALPWRGVVWLELPVVCWVLCIIAHTAQLMHGRSWLFSHGPLPVIGRFASSQGQKREEEEERERDSRVVAVVLG